METHSFQKYTGPTTRAYACPRGHDTITLVAEFGFVPENAGFKFLVEQFFNKRWCVLGGADVDQLVKRERKLRWRFYEQLLLDPKQAETTQEYQMSNAIYKQLAICPKVRITTEGYSKEGWTSLEYSLDVVSSSQRLPAHLCAVSSN